MGYRVSSVITPRRISTGGIPRINTVLLGKIMPRLYFMNREFEGLCIGLHELIEGQDVRLLFGDSWYWLHYEFFQCRDHICSEQSSVVRTHLFNLAAMLYRGFEDLPGGLSEDADTTLKIIAELLEIAEYAESFPVCLWIYGDETSKQELSEACGRLPSPEQTEFLMSLPHSRRRERERLSYAHDEPRVALKRYRNEYAAFNKRTKQAAHRDRKAEQPGTGQPATRPVDKPEGSDKPQPEAEGRSR